MIFSIKDIERLVNEAINEAQKTADHRTILYLSDAAPEPGRFDSLDKHVKWDKDRVAAQVRVWDYDPNKVSLEQWAEKSGYNTRPEKFVPYEVWKSSPGIMTFQIVQDQSARGYDELEPKYGTQLEPLPDDRPEWARAQRERAIWAQEQRLKAGYDQLVKAKDPSIYTKEYYRGPNPEKLWRNESSMTGYDLEYTGYDYDIEVSADEQAYRNAGDKPYTKEQLQKMFEEDKLMYKKALDAEMVHVQKMLRATDITRAPVETGAVAGTRGAIDSLGKRDGMVLQDILEKSKYLDISEADGKTKLYSKMEDLIKGERAPPRPQPGQAAKRREATSLLDIKQIYSEEEIRRNAREINLLKIIANCKYLSILKLTIKALLLIIE